MEIFPLFIDSMISMDEKIEKLASSEFGTSVIKDDDKKKSTLEAILDLCDFWRCYHRDLDGNVRDLQCSTGIILSEWLDTIDEIFPIVHQKLNK